MFRVLIAHSSEVYAVALKRRLDRDCRIHLCHDGPQTLSALDRFQPDILLLHAAMPRKDALSILRQSLFTPRMVLVTTNYLDGKILHQLQALGVQQILIMPSLATAGQYIRNALADLHSSSASQSLEYLTVMHLHRLRFGIHLDGYRQLRTGVPLLCRDPEQPLTKQLYPAIAEALDLLDWRAVERSIRKSIRQAWETRDNDVWASYFPPDEFGNTPCPSNKQFLLRLAELVRKESNL